MSEFRLIARGIDPTAGLIQIDGRPELWNRNPLRLFADGPHRETEDMWLRYRPAFELTGPHSHREPHFSAFYPAWYALPALRPIVFGLAALVEATHLGGVMLTRIRPGRQVFPHNDRGSWHSQYHNMKVWLPLRANDGCINRCNGEAIVMAPGEAWTFSNLEPHSVSNNGSEERICLIVCMRVEP